ncbi:MAG: hypothetical protein M2R45_02108 [Verrucomicrobia subdivision 3 bacterium]|nr:hypothetical protein [Limisphaerales bacterium]MCS1413833.1 hypothetical protein [Limisphaerales bacterium]
MLASFKMSGFVRKLAITLVVVVGGGELHAFALLGPRPPWQTATLGYTSPPPATFEGGAGPMNLNEEYRWNVPEIYYGYSPEFLSYFGQKGVDAIEEAVAMLNDLPSLEDVDLNDYQLESGRINLRALALGLTDIKSAALSLILQVRGLSDPTRYVFTLRNRYIPNPPLPIFYHVIKRNFDPVTLRPSSFVNGTLWTYVVEELGDNRAWAFNFPVDPLERLLPRTLPVAGVDLNGLPDGFFWTQLTRDDVGGLKHIYRRSNFNPENSVAGVSDGTGGIVDGGATAPVGFPGGGGTYDFPGGNVGVGGGPYDFPFNAFTNNVNAPPVGNVGVGNTPVAPAATRAGIDMLNMVRSDYDALLGVYFNPLEMRYSETILTNNRVGSRALTRTVIQPDIIFDASDIQGGDGTSAWLIWNVTVADNNWLNSDALDGVSGDDFGPGVVNPPFRIRFNTAGDVLLNENPSFVTEESGIRLLTWGSFDGTTNDPVVFPVGTSIFDLESQVR